MSENYFVKPSERKKREAEKELWNMMFTQRNIVIMSVVGTFGICLIITSIIRHHSHK